VNATNLALPSAIAFFTNSSSNAETYFWDFGDGNFSSDENPWHEYTTAGTYTAMLIVSNGGCASDTMTFTINVGAANLLELNEELVVFPNPFTDNITIECEADAFFRLFDAQGREVVFDLESSNNSYSLSNFRSNAGTYLVEIHVGNRIWYQKVVKN
jgi:PKD repeat protein